MFPLVVLFEIHCWSAGKGSPLVSVLQGERRGSLEFVRNETAFVDFKKKFGDEFTEVMPDIMADTSEDHSGMSTMRRANISSIPE